MCKSNHLRHHSRTLSTSPFSYFRWGSHSEEAENTPGLDLNIWGFGALLKGTSAEGIMAPLSTITSSLLKSELFFLN